MVCINKLITRYANHLYDPMIDPKQQKIRAEYPFLSYIIYGGNEYIGIIQNIDDTIATIYDYGMLCNAEQKDRFLELGEQWWFESNRLVPINIFLRSDWTVFKCILKTFNAKDVQVMFGPHLNLKELAQKRSKKKSITLVRRVP